MNEDETRKWVAAYQRARREHAYMLRQKGLKLREIAQCLGVTHERIRQVILREERRLRAAEHRSTWDIEVG